MSNQQSENKICQNCKNDFVIASEDFAFYEKMGVPAPTFCPECRLIRRMTWRYNRSLYKSSCNLCSKQVISIYNPDSKYTIYCSKCWWSDNWSADDYGRDYDFSRPFFEQFHELSLAIPRDACPNNNIVNCEYSPGAGNSKNCYLALGAYFSENCMYSFGPIMSKNSIDSDLGINMDMAYGCHNSDAIFNSKFVYFSEECIDSNFLFDCTGCTSCFGCVNLRKKKYCIFNKQYSKEEYKEKMQYWDLGSYKILQEAEKMFNDFYYSMPRRYTWVTGSVNVTGDNIKNSKNCKSCFGALNGIDDCKFMFTAGLNFKDSYDCGVGGAKSELCYEVMGCTGVQRNIATKSSINMVDAAYSDRCTGGENIFGCSHLRNKSYSILNKQYSKEEYKILRGKIIQHMNEMPYIDNVGNVYRYGEFFPSDISPWSYDESLANEWFPLDKNKAIEKGYRWSDSVERDYQITLRADDIPDYINDIDETILDQVIECSHKGSCNDGCTTAFRIIPDELKLYKQMNIALPRMCHNCRYYKRIALRNPAKLWTRTCQCAGNCSDCGTYNNQDHHTHGDGHCSNEFETAISPERREIVYCQQCYNDEFI